MVDVPALGGLEDDAHRRPFAGGVQYFVNCGRSQKRGDGQFAVFFVFQPVGKDKDLHAFLYGRKSVVCQFCEGGGKIVLEEEWEGLGFVTREPLQFVFCQDRSFKLYQFGAFRRFLKDVSAVANVGHDRHDLLFPDGVDGRIGDLGEALVEIVEEGMVFFGEGGKRAGAAHGANLFLAVFAHKLQGFDDVRLVVIEEFLLGGEVFWDRGGSDFRE